MNPKKIFTIHLPISKIKYIKNGELVVIDENNSVRKYDLENLKLSGGFRIKLPKNRVYGNALDISRNGKYMGLGIVDKNKAVIWNLETKKPKYTLGWHRGEIEVVTFDEQGHYVSTGGVDGRSYIWSLTTGKMVGTLAPHADYVTSIGYSNNGYWIATGSYDKSIAITNISSMKFAFKLHGHSGAITQLKFMDKFRLLSCDKQGEIILWNYAKGKVIKRIPKSPNEVTALATDKDEKYLFLAPKGKSVILYDLENFEIVTYDYIKVSSNITALEFIPELNYLIIGTFDGIVYIFDILEDEKELEDYIKEKKYDLAYKLVAENPLLEKSETYKKLEKIWEETSKKCYKLLEKGEIDAVKQIFEPFMVVSSKRMIIQSILKDFAEFNKFKMLVEKKKYPLAYSLANQYKSFKDTIYYKKMEQDWNNAFKKARALMFDKTKDDLVKKLLLPFRGVSEKTPLIQSLSNEKDIYKLLKMRLAKKDFEDFFKLVDKYPFLTELDEYRIAMNFGEKLHNQILHYLENGEYNKVLSHLKLLEQFPKYKDEAKTLKEKATITANFMNLVASKDYNKVYEYVQKAPFLENIKIFKDIEEKWIKNVITAEKLASKGEVSKILQLLKNYMNIKDKNPKIRELVKSAYLNQILELLKSRNFTEEKLKKGFKKYIEIFGFDSEISDLIEISQKAGIKVDLSNIEEGNKVNWYKKELPNSIFE